MDFPAYVPAAVRALTERVIQGEKEGEGLEAALASAEPNLSEIEVAIAATPRRGAAARLQFLRIRRAEAAEHRDRLAGDIASLLRLALDERMRKAFTLLTPEISDDGQWVAFVRSAWQADLDFAKFRDRLRKAAELTDKIAKTADVLAAALREFAETGVDDPCEFDSIQRLLASTNHAFDHRDSEHWQILKAKVLGVGGGEKRHTTMNSMGRGPLSMSLSVHSAADEPSYVWTLAPSVADVIDALAGTARGFSPEERGMIGAATKSRQRSRKTEYVRAFGNRLTDDHGFAQTKPIMQAMAIAANVVLNQPDVDVTYDDVRKAVAKRGGGPLENSGEK